jgi:hypothetical protein
MRVPRVRSGRPAWDHSYWRFSVRKLMVIVAILGTLCGITVEATRRRRTHRFGGLVAFHAEKESYWRDQAAAMLKYEAEKVAEGDPLGDARVFASQAAFDQAWADYHYQLRIKYENATRNPMLPVSPDPPPSRLSPRDYWSKEPRRESLPKK